MCVFAVVKDRTQHPRMHCQFILSHKHDLCGQAKQHLHHQVV